MLAKLDAWLGLHVFHPPAILLCRLFRCTQYQLSRDMWFLGLVWSTWRVGHSGNTPWWLVGLMLACCLSSGFRAAWTKPEVPSPSFPVLRLVFLTTLLVTLSWGQLANNLFLLVAEYAATIVNLPPPPVRKVRRLTKARI